MKKTKRGRPVKIESDRQPYPNPRQITEKEMRRKGMTLRQLMKSTPRLFKDNANDITIKKYNANAKTKAGHPAVTAVMVANVTATHSPPLKHRCWIIGLDKNNPVINKQKRVLAQCACNAYLYYAEYANAVHGAARILYSNGEPPRTTNPGLVPMLCIAAGEKVATANGEIPIENIKPGDKIHTLLGLDEVIAKSMTRKNTEVIKVTSYSGNSVVCTRDHLLMAIKNQRIEWVEAQHLINNEDCILICNPSSPLQFKFDKVKSLDHAGFTDVYDLEVLNFQHFIVNNIVVHNCKHLYRLAMEMIDRND